MIDVREVTESYSAFDFVSEAKMAIEDIDSRGKLAIIAGGTGLYIQSLLEGYHLGGETPHEEILAYRASLEPYTDEELAHLVDQAGLEIPQFNRRVLCVPWKLPILVRIWKIKRPCMNH